MKNVYLVQHAEPRYEPKEEITEKGHQDTEKISKYAAEHLRISVDRIFHSEKPRAKETAEVLARFLKPSKGIEESDNLKPKDDLKVWLDRLSNIKEDVMIVGHMPFLSNFAYCLITDLTSPKEEKIGFEKSGIVCLAKQKKDWSLKWMVTPDMIRTTIE